MYDFDTTKLFELANNATQRGMTVEYTSDTGILITHTGKKNKTIVWVKRKSNVQFYHIHIIVADLDFVIKSSDVSTSLDLSLILIANNKKIISHMADTILSDEEFDELGNDFIGGLK